MGMDRIRIHTITEDDFDRVVEIAGGRRIDQPGSADYRLNEAVVELKLVVEEALDKKTHQKKIAEIFQRIVPDSPVVLIRPQMLNGPEARSYYRVVETPIKTAVKKASKQLQKTSERLEEEVVRVLVILNIGYTLLTPDEFKDVCFKCTCHDTSGIDYIIVGGIYFLSDGYENRVMAPFEGLSIDLSRSFPSRTLLMNAWGTFLNSMMTQYMRSGTQLTEGKLPLMDLVFDLDGKTFIKPSPKGPSSDFWPGGSPPRRNSSVLSEDVRVASVFPTMTREDWECFRNVLSKAKGLKNSFEEWERSRPCDDSEECDPLKPTVGVRVCFKDFASWCSTPQSEWTFNDVNNYALSVFNRRAIEYLERSQVREETDLLALQYVYFVVQEIGGDQGNDLTSIYYVSEIPGFKRKTALVENARAFFEYAGAVASAYAVKHEVDALYYSRVRL